MQSTDPYAPPLAELIVCNDGEDATMIRETHIRHEVSVRSVGLLYYLGGMFGAIGGVGLLAVQLDDGEVEVGFTAVYILIGVALFVIGYGLRSLRRWVRAPVAIVSGIGLLGFPVGTLISGYVLYLLFCKKGRMIFSDHYGKIVRKTPHVRYRTSMVVWALLVVILGAIVAAVIIPRVT